MVGRINTVMSVSFIALGAEGLMPIRKCRVGVPSGL